MKNRAIILAALILLGLSAIIPGRLNAGDARYVPGEVLVKFKKGTHAKDTGNLHATLKASKKRELPRLRLHRLKLPKQMSVEDAVSRYEQDPNVEYAEPNYMVQALATEPNDPAYLDNLQWALDNINDTDIDAPEAWDITTGSDNILIAVIDSGLAFVDSDLTNYNPEFIGNVWTNDAELNGSALIDDDGNGYVDDFYGWDFIDGDGYPLDLNGHGTHVAGTIAARGNNDTGITGVLWDAKIMPVRFLGLEGSGSTFDAIGAIQYAYNNGARIMNNSWGSAYHSDSLQDIIEEYDDALFIFSAGNTGMDNDSSPIYPASFNSPNIISVAATDRTDELASFSSYGAASVDLAAPGVYIISTIPQFSYDEPVTVYPVEDFEGSTGDLPQQGWEKGGTNSTWAVTAGTGVSGSNSLEDSLGGNYANNTLTWAYYSTSVDSSAKGQRYLLTFDVRGDLELDYDWLDIIYTDDDNDESSWDWIDSLTGSQSSFISYTADYTPVAETLDSFYFGFRIDSDFSNQGDGAYIDNIKMTSEVISITSYHYSNAQGTSVAAPHVTGVAGLLLASDPALTNLEIKDILLESVDPVADLSGKVLTGGRLNAYSALLNTIPPDAPSNLAATAVSSYQVNLSWSDNSANEDGFEIERKTDINGPYSQIAKTGQDVTSYTDTGRAASTTYYYRVRSYNRTGNSAFSNEADATTSDAAVSASGGGGSGGCFIATAAYGSYLAPEVEVLKQFRDNRLMTNPAGRKAVELYYIYSPPLADLIRESETLRAISRLALTPVVMLIAHPNTSLLVFFMFFTAIFSSFIVYRKQ